MISLSLLHHRNIDHLTLLHRFRNRFADPANFAVPHRPIGANNDVLFARVNPRSHVLGNLRRLLLNVLRERAAIGLYDLSQITRAATLREETAQTTGALQAEERALAERQAELADIESARRLAAREAGTAADREAERALALAEQARDLDGLVEELEGAAALRQRLAALPGPELRPGSNSGNAPATPTAAATAAERSAPRPYVLPVTGRTVAGFGASQGAGLSQGLTLAPIAGAQVIAPAEGRVGFAGSYRGFGRIVIIEHEGGWTSLITGLARLDVRTGQELVGGAPLGIAGPGNPQITLELRRDGEPVNPLLYTR